MDNSDEENTDVKKLVKGMIGDLMDQIDDIEVGLLEISDQAIYPSVALILK